MAEKCVSGTVAHHPVLPCGQEGYKRPLTVGSDIDDKQLAKLAPILRPACVNKLCSWGCWRLAKLAPVLRSACIDRGE
jgi:hypothetical protein